MPARLVALLAALVLALALAPAAPAATRNGPIRWTNGPAKGAQIGTISIATGSPDAIRGAVRLPKGTWTLAITLVQPGLADFSTTRTVTLRRRRTIALPGFRRELGAGTTARAKVAITRVGRVHRAARGSVRVRV